MRVLLYLHLCSDLFLRCSVKLILWKVGGSVGAWERDVGGPPHVLIMSCCLCKGDTARE